MTLSGTTNDLSSLLRFFLVRLPTSGIFSHSESVTAASPRFKSANCCWIFGRSARCLASSSFSRASLSSHIRFEHVAQDSRRNSPPRSPPRVHIMVNLLIYLVGFLVICLICCTGKETVLIVWILELVRVNFCFLTTASLCLTEPESAREPPTCK